MPVITIYQGVFARRGEEAAQHVATTLGYRRVSREVLLEASERYGIPEAKLNEILEKEPHWWEHWAENLRPYRVALQSAMCEVAQGKGTVYHGDLGHELLPDTRHVLKVFLTAPLEFRVKEVEAEQKISDTAARRYIEHTDKARTRRLMAMFGTDWRDPTRYDLTVNMAKMSGEAAGRLIVETTRLADYQPTASSEEDFQNFTLSARVQAALVMSPGFRNLNISVRADHGLVTLSGVLLQRTSQQAIVQHVEKIPGVTKVISDLVIPATAPARGF